MQGIKTQIQKSKKKNYLVFQKRVEQFTVKSIFQEKKISVNKYPGNLGLTIIRNSDK
jgi:hypothetical protein